jgi:tetratricopeptide (TPR) repeat protein
MIDRLTVFARELQRRRVFRVAVVYGAVAFVVAQAADIAFPALQLPGWTLTLVVVLMLVGFPVALVLAWAFEVTPDGVRREEPRRGPAAGTGATAPGSPGPILPRGVARAAWFALGVLVAASLGWYGVARLGGGDQPELDARYVAVVPFRVAGADPALAYLREGMVDLLAAKLTGDGGARAVDPRTVMSAWRRAVPRDDQDLDPAAAAALGRGLGAGRVVLGEVVGAPGRLILTASALDTRSGRRAAPVTVDGPPDSLPALVDRLAGALLMREAGEAEHRLASLTSTSLPALRSYLRGRSDYRLGRFDEALGHYRTALQHDSTFALAALGGSRAAGWTLHRADDGPALLALAWQHRDRLGVRDRRFLDAVAGPTRPDLRSARDRLEAWERVVRESPDDPEAWYEYGDVLLHYHRFLGDDALDRAQQAFERGYSLDPGFGVLRIHLADAALNRGDHATLLRMAEEHLAEDSTSWYGLFMRISRTVVLGQDVDMEPLIALLERSDDADLVMGFMIIFPFDHLPVAWLEPLYTLGDHAYRLAPARARTAEERRIVMERRRRLALNRGRTADALEATRELAATSGDPLLEARLNLLAGLHWDGDAEAARRGGERIEAAARDAGGAPALAGTRSGREALCALGQWRLAGQDGTGARGVAGARNGSARAAIGPVVTALRSPTDEGAVAALVDGLCVELLEAWAAHADGEPDVADRLHRLDQRLADGPPVTTGLLEQGNLILARLFEERGELAAARAAMRRHVMLPGGEVFGSVMLREQGRLASLMGDRTAAARAYQVYLVLQADPQPGPAAARVAAVRREMARLVERP